MISRLHSLFLFTGFILISGTYAFADCGNPATAKELLDCVLKSDPRVLSSEQQVKRAEGLAKAAGAWSNPEIEGEYSRAAEGGTGERITASLTQKVEWGSGAKAAKLEWEARRAEHRLLRQEILGETVLRLVRLTQVDEERKLVEGQIRLCEKGLLRFKGLAFLTAEQRAGKQALEWGRERLGLEVLELESESQEIRSELAVSLDRGNFPSEIEIPHKTVWPQWPSPIADPSILAVETNRGLAAKAEEEKEDASALPALSLGPVFEKESDGLSSVNFWGAKLSLGLPLWNRNEGKREAAQASAREGAIRKSAVQKRLELNRGLLKERYGKAVERLAGLEAKVESGAEKLAAIRTDYLEGRLPLPLALEAYRGMEDLLKRFHETERAAYGSLWRGYALEDVAENQTP